MISTLPIGGSSQSLTVALTEYHAAWNAFRVIHHLDILERLAVPTTIGWKVADAKTLYANLAALATVTEQAHIGVVNQRLIASVLLNDDFESMRIIKLLQRRPQSSDRLGLDHIDYLVTDMLKIHMVLKEAGAHVNLENNDMHEWLSLRFGGKLEFEAKFVDHLVLDVAIRELQQAELSLIRRAK